MNIENIFLDRDGTIIQDRHYLSSPQQIEPIPSALESLKGMCAAGLSLFLVTNQSGIGRGFFTREDYFLVHESLMNMLAEEKITVKDSAFCPHAPQDQCFCRKPAPGLWHELSARHGLHPEKSVIIGDKISDVLFGQNCGFAASILVCTGKGMDALEKLNAGLQGREWLEPLPVSGLCGSLAVAARDLAAAWKWLQRRHF